MLKCISSNFMQHTPGAWRTDWHYRTSHLLKDILAAGDDYWLPIVNLLRVGDEIIVESDQLSWRYWLSVRQATMHPVPRVTVKLLNPLDISNGVQIFDYGVEKDKEEALEAEYNNLMSQTLDIPMYIGSEEVRTGNTATMHPPHNHKHTLGQYHRGGAKEAKAAIANALEAREAWANTSWEHRASIFMKCAELLAGPFRMRMNAATMLAQSKNAHQAEIDAACEMIDFFRFNVEYMTDIFKDQPASAPGIWNRVEYRPLEGFVYAITPFNFTSIAANLPAAAALMGNVVVWKPSDHQAYSAQVIVDLFKEAGLPDGVINVVYGDPVMITDTILASPDFSGLHFTGSTFVFKELWKKIGENIHTYKTYPRIVGETGGKDFIWAHNSANPLQVATGITRGAFEFQGQKCSAASRSYIPASIWEEVKGHLISQASELKMGSPEDPSNFVNAVIHEGSFDKIASYIDAAKADAKAKGEELEVYINTPGGSLIDGVAICNHMLASDYPVTTINIGVAISMGFIALQCGTTRKAYKSTTSLAHACSGVARGTVTDLKNAIGLMESLNSNMVDIVAAKTGKTSEEIQNLYFLIYILFFFNYFMTNRFTCFFIFNFNNKSSRLIGVQR